MNPARRRLTLACIALLAAPLQTGLALPARPARPIRIAIDAEFSIPGSTSAQAIYYGAQVAVNEINAAGGVLGRPLEIVQRDNRGVPARALNNLRELAADPEVVAVLCGKYSPAVVELLPEIHRLQIPFLDPWAAADPISDNGFSPNYVFRLSLRDTWAMQVMLRQAASRGARNVALLLPNSEWGRSNLRAAEHQVIDSLGHNVARNVPKSPGQKIVAIEWYNFGDRSLLLQYRNLLAAGAQAIILVANEQEGVVFVNELATLPADQRRPIMAHWGLTAGQFFALAQEALRKVDLSVVQTFSFIDKNDPKTQKLLAALPALTGNGSARKVASPTGVAHAHDLVHLLARAIKQAGTTRRASIRKALEQLGPYQGITRHFERPFTAQRHDALGIENVFMARFAHDGAIEPLNDVRQRGVEPVESVERKQ